MQEKMLFIIGSPRSGTTMLQRMLGSHDDIYTHPEPHIITPLAHLGYFDTVEKAPYDHINAAEAITQFVDELPNKEQDYLDACRAYTDILYGRVLEPTGKRFFLDKTPAYALVIKFLVKLYPQAKFIVLTRNPLAILSSYANSFFDGDYQAAYTFNNILGRYIPEIAWLLREKPVSLLHLQYENVVTEPQQAMESVCDYLDLIYDDAMVNYGSKKHTAKSYGDPKVKYHSRPTTSSIQTWAKELANDKTKLELAMKIVKPIAAEDITMWGYDKKTLFDPINDVPEGIIDKPKHWKWDSYRMQRKVFLSLQPVVQKNKVRQSLKKMRYYCDVLLRQ